MDKFASTTLVHLKTVAYAVALEEQQNGLPVILSDPTTYGYYKNLAGIPTQSNSTNVKVISIDTNQEINLLDINTDTSLLTVKSFLNQDSIFLDVLTKYPKDILLIYGIMLNLGTVEDLVSLKDGSILWHDSSWLSSREVDAITLLEQDIQKHLYEFDNILFTETDDLYASGLLLAIKTLIETRLPVIRDSYVESRQVPDYIIEKRLSSYYDLGKVMELPDEIKVWLYHNLPYLSINVGKQETFQDLVEHVVKPLKFNVTDTFIKSVHPKEVILNGVTVPKYTNCIFRTTLSGATVSENYSSILMNKLNKDVTFKDSLIANEQYNYFDKHYKLEENTRYFRIGEAITPIEPPISRFTLVFEAICIELLNETKYYLVETIDGNIMTMSPRHLYMFLMALFIKSLGGDINTPLFKYPTSTIFYDKPLPLIVNEQEFTPLLSDLTTDFPLTTKVIDMYIHNLHKWYRVAEHTGLHQSSYNMFVTRIIDSLTTNNPIGYTATNIGQELRDNNIIIPNDYTANIINIMTNNFGIVVNEREITGNNLAIVEDIMTKLTSYTVEVVKSDIGNSKITLNKHPLQVMESMGILYITEALYNCNGYAVEDILADADDVTLHTHAMGTSSLTINDESTPAFIVTMPTKTIKQYNKSNITIS